MITLVLLTARETLTRNMDVTKIEGKTVVQVVFWLGSGSTWTTADLTPRICGFTIIAFVALPPPAYVRSSVSGLAHRDVLREQPNGRRCICSFRTQEQPLCHRAPFWHRRNGEGRVGRFLWSRYCSQLDAWRSMACRFTWGFRV